MTDDTLELQRLKRWRLVLGEAAQQPPAPTAESFDLSGLNVVLDADEQQIDHVLQALYDSDRKAGLGSSCPQVNRWLGDIRKYFSTSNVRILQRDALERLKLHKLLLEPETLEQIEPDVHLVGTLIALKQVIPNKTRETARSVVRRVVEEIERKLKDRMVVSIRGALNRVSRTNRPRPQEIDWDRTIRRNLKHYLPEQQTIIPAQLIGHGRRQTQLRRIMLCVDQSGSMAASIVYASIFAAVLASMRSLQTDLVVFDTEVVDLTEQLQDPVDVLFAAQLGGGTDINRAVGYCLQRIERPQQTIFVLISDLFEGGDAAELLRKVARLQNSGVQTICLLALNDDGAPSYNEHLTDSLAELGVPAFACTPDLFPDLLTQAIRRHNIPNWAGEQQLLMRSLPGRHSPGLTSPEPDPFAGNDTPNEFDTF